MDFVAAFGVFAAVLTVSALIAGIVERAPLSFPMVFLALGVLLGTRGLGIVDVTTHSQVLEIVATVTLAFVLFLDGLNLEVAGSRRDLLVPLLALGPGTLLTAAIVAGAGMALLDLGVLPALLLGMILSSTDPVVLRDVLADRRIPDPVRRALKIEAGTNDVVVLPSVLILIAVIKADVGGVADWAVFTVQLFLLGPVMGFAVGAAGSWLLARADQRFTVRREYQSLYGVGLVLGSYAAGVGVGGDGFLAAFAAGVAITVLNRSLCDCFLEFGHATTEMAMLLAFVLFGAVLSTMTDAVPIAAGIAVAIIAIFLARPLVISGLLALHSTSLSSGARAFIAWFGPRGLNSLLFALLVVAADVPGGDLLFAATGLVVIVSVVAHGVSATPFASWYARRLERETLAEERATSASGLFRLERAEAPRIEADELATWLRSDDPPVVLDVRTRSQYARDPVTIPGSIRVHPAELDDWARGKPAGLRVALWCT